jgi:hypothetical protein
MIKLTIQENTMVVLDYSKAEIVMLEAPEDISEDNVEEFLNKNGLDVTECSWMYGGIR